MDIYRRSLILNAVMMTVYSALPLRVSQAIDFNYHLKARRIADNTYAVIGKLEYFTGHNGGAVVNTAFIETSEGVIVIDTGPSRRYGEQLKSLISETTGKEVIRVYNTHFHPDHCFGNQLFDARQIAALPKTISGLKESGDGFSDNFYRLLGDWMRGTEIKIPGLPITFSSEKFGDHRLELIALSGHTNADLVILDHKTDVLFAGDLCFLDRTPTTPHADLQQWQSSLNQLKKVPHKLILPGHGVADPTDRSIEQTSDYLSWLEKSLNEQALQGKDMIEAAKLEIPEKFENLQLIKAEIERSVAHLYPGIEQNILQVISPGGR